MVLKTVALDDKYTLDQGQIFTTGLQALVRLPLMQHRLDQLTGLNTGGFISGYRGSPLGGFDQALWKARKYLNDCNIKFQPGINEDLGATAVWGSQQVHLSPGANVDGVFAMWYGKGPGVDRTGDVFKHANAAGSSRFGGVLALAGDDHACKSSTMPHQSEYAFIDAFMPVIHPANVQDILDLGIYGWALSRYSGLWVGFKMLSDTVDTAASVSVSLDRYNIQMPEDFTAPPGGLNLRWPDVPLEQEQRLHDYKLKAVPAFVRANHLDKIIWRAPQPRFGIITVGKSYLDTRQALHDLGFDEDTAKRLGISLYKVVVSWPLEPEGIKEFCNGLQNVLVIEEKRPIIEQQVRDILYHMPADQRPNISGKTTPAGQPLLPSTYEFSSQQVTVALVKCLQLLSGFDNFQERFANILAAAEVEEQHQAKILRLPYYCSGCPHNTSTTQLPEGSRAMAGIGCHYMATWIDHRTSTFTQMGGEGVPWIGAAPFTTEKHIFANLGDGTYYHSGLLAIRAAVAANVNITYKILYNDAVAMTGGQPVDGPLSVADITHQLRAEGVHRIAIVVDDLKRYKGYTAFAAHTTVNQRDDLAAIQEELKATAGVTVLIYDQTCAAEKRRRRKRKLMEDPNRRIFINETVCEGCGDCGKKSNCLSVTPLETEWGRKRTIDQSSCNKDYSCVKGFCPSFVSVIGGSLKRADAATTPEALFNSLPDPISVSLKSQPYNVFITGVGGTGVITIGALIGMAAHLEGKGCSVVDMAGLAQKGGGVISHLKISAQPGEILATRVSQADLILGFDMVVTAGNDGLSRIVPGTTKVVLNDHQTITGHFTKNPDYVFPADAMKDDILAKAGQENTHLIRAHYLATHLLGDSIMTNLFMVGYALQLGLIPVSAAALKEAIRLNGVAVDDNITAFNWGRLAAVQPEIVNQYVAAAQTVDPDHVRSETAAEIIDRRAMFLKDYQNQAYANQYLNFMRQVRNLEGMVQSEELTKIVAQTLFRLMAYKDEYEVARLYADGNFIRRLRQQFTGSFKLQFHLAPPLLSRRDKQTGELQKMTFGGWILPVFNALRKLKFLRGTPLDIFGYSQERRMERQLITDYESLIQSFLPTIASHNYQIACELAAVPQSIRGYGHVKHKNYLEAQEKIKALQEKMGSLT